MKNVGKVATGLGRKLVAWGGLMLVALTISAEQVNEQEAESKARRFFAQQEQAVQRRNARTMEVDVVRVSLNAEQRRSIAPLQSADSREEAFYIYNRADGEGFVIISGESETSEVLAYSLEGAFHPESMNQGADRFLQFYASEIARIRTGQAQPLRHEARPTGQRVLLSTVNLNQNTIYFNSRYAPKHEGKYCLAGCGPVSLATVMAYHKWPETPGTGSQSYTTDLNGISLSCDFEAEEPIDWSLIKSGVTMAGKASNECSRLLYQCGVAVHADYDPYSTNSYIAGIVFALREVFHYDACTTLDRSFIPTVEEWDDIMINELDNQRPVIVCAQGGINDWDRHIFVVDGYNTTGLYHYNLGWGGQNNGYYADGKISSSNLYMCDGIVYGIKPLREEREQTACLALKNVRICEEWKQYGDGSWDPIPSEDGVGSKRNFDLTAYGLQNCYHETLNGHVRAELHSQDGKRKAVISNLAELNGLQAHYFYYWFYVNCTIPATVRVLPTDYVCLSFRHKGTTKWLPIYCVDDLTSYVHVDRELALPVEAPLAQPTSAFRGYYDLQGRSLPQAPQKGLYIKDGRKVVKK